MVLSRKFSRKVDRRWRDLQFSNATRAARALARVQPIPRHLPLLALGRRQLLRHHDSQLSPSPLNRDATRLHQPFSHHVDQSYGIFEPLTSRTTPHTHSHDVYRSLVSAGHGSLRRWEARPSWLERRVESVWELLRSWNMIILELMLTMNVSTAPCMP